YGERLNRIVFVYLSPAVGFPPHTKTLTNLRNCWTDPLQYLDLHLADRYLTIISVGWIPGREQGQRRSTSRSIVAQLLRR
ncbi:hypothetical protein WA026_020579, partial [Henosepilachna vigintioctopunctata]